MASFRRTLFSLAKGWRRFNNLRIFRQTAVINLFLTAFFFDFMFILPDRRLRWDCVLRALLSLHFVRVMSLLGRWISK